MLRTMLPVLGKLQNLASSGSTVGFVYGNRDFLAGSAALGPFGITCLGEQADITLGELRVHITHGHSLCLSDTEFLAYKKRMWPMFRILDRLLPGRLEHFIARKFIIRSKQVVNSQDQSRFLFTRSAIEDHFRRGIDAVVCGHRHVEETFSVGAKHFYALGCWEDSSGPYLVHREGEFTRAIFTAA
jgi:UDP-2,3-diacylglucosamine hydrolase